MFDIAAVAFYMELVGVRRSRRKWRGNSREEEEGKMHEKQFGRNGKMWVKLF